jgi:hypothetical protein
MKERGLPTSHECVKHDKLDAFGFKNKYVLFKYQEEPGFTAE